MKADNGKYDPLSTNALVTRKMEKKAHGCSPDSHLDVKAELNKQSGVLQSVFHQEKKKDELRDEFINLMLTDSEEPVHQQEFQAVEKKFEKKSVDHGTSANFFALNKQEVKESAKEPFSLNIVNSSLGELEVKGEYKGGTLILTLKSPKPLDVKEREMLSVILKAKLSKELQVPMEVYVECLTR